MSIIRNFLTKLQRCPYQISRFSTTIETPTTIEPVPSSEIVTSPIISTASHLNEEFLYQAKRQVWIENLDTPESKKLGLMTLNPEVYADRPRVSVLFHNIRWQKMYRWVNYKHTRNRAEMPGGGRKPWPQKGLGKARHGSIRSPIFKNGGIAHGARSPASHFYMPPFHIRVFGLTTALSVKLAQEDLYVVNDLEIPSKDPAYLEALIEERNWGPAVLFVDKDDVMPQNITLASDEIDHVNLMPVYGLNVYSMLKHHTLVLTTRAAREIEDKILFQLNRPDMKNLLKKFKLSQA